MFYDRTDAGLALASALMHYKHADAVVLAIPRGGVPVAYPVARILRLPLEVILSKKIGHPANKEYAIGALSLTGRVIIPHAEVPASYIEAETRSIRARLRKMYRKYMGEREPAELKDRIVILIDDGIATGNTLLSTIEMIKKEAPKKIVVAAPVASPRAAEKISHEVDEFVCVRAPDDFYAVGQYYENFEQVSDEEVIAILNQSKIDLAKAG